tara:strand:- start:489 stop:659 length:171 start_codon:yes stop_codon:yes gene_type:complete
MFTSGIKFSNFKIKSKSIKIKRLLKLLLNKENSILESLSNKYKYSYEKKKIKKISK